MDSRWNRIRGFLEKERIDKEMAEKRLLERLQAHAGALTKKNDQGEFEPLTVSIIDSLKKILNTRQGTVQTDPDFGIPDFALLSGGFSVIEAEHVEATIQAVILKYEPRLTQLIVRFEESSLAELQLKFRLEGTVIYGQSEVSIQLESQMSAHNSFEVERTRD